MKAFVCWTENNGYPRELRMQ